MSNMADLTQRKAIQKTGIRGNNQLWTITKFPLHKGNLDGKTYCRRLFPHTLPHGNHTFILCRLCMTHGFSHIKGEGKKIITTQLHCNTNIFYMQSCLRQLCTLQSLICKLTAPIIVFEVYIHRAGNMPHKILLSIFLIMVSIDLLV